MKTNLLRALAFTVAYCLLSVVISAQTCAIVDSITINQSNNDFIHPIGITYDGTGFWVSGTNTDNDRLYKVDMNGNRIDSILYDEPLGPFAIEGMVADGNTLWAVRYSTDTLYKYNLTTHALEAAYSIGGTNPVNEEYTSIGLRGDTLLLLGNVSGNKFIFLKSTTHFISLPVGVYDYPTGLLNVSNRWFATSYVNNHPPKSFYLLDSLYDAAQTTVQTWCVEKNQGLTTDGQYLYQTCWTSKKVYKISTDLVLTGIPQPPTATASFSLFPNPATNTVTITVENPERVSNPFGVTITDITGRRVAAVQLETTNLKLETDFSNGIYFVSVISPLSLGEGSGVRTKKLIINR